MVEEIKALISKTDEDGLFRLLRSLTPEDKKKLAPAVKKAVKEAGQYRQVGNTFKRGVDDPHQLHLYQLVAFVCLNRTDYERTPLPTWILEKKWAGKVIDWYCPSWFGDYFNSCVESPSLWLPEGYALAVELMDRGYLQPSPLAIATLLPNAVFNSIKGGFSEYHPGNLLQHPLTLSEHLWYLFQFETSIQFAGRYLRFQDSVDHTKIGWEPLFADFSARGLIDRQRLLRESLLASHRNFNQSLSGWFAGLFETLEPTPDELVELQHELIIVLGAPATKPVSVALRALRKIVRNPGFDAEGMFDAAPLLLASDTKVIIIATLGLLEDINKAFPANGARAALVAATVFLHPADELQTRAAKLIAKAGDPADPSLRSELGAVQDQLLTGARQLLEPFLGPVATPEPAASVKPVDSAEPQPISFPATVDDLIFLASHAFDNTVSWHFDVLPAALVAFAPRLQPTDLEQLEPAFQRAVGLVKSYMNSSQGHLDWLLALFMIDFGNWLITRHPGASAGIDKVIRAGDKEQNGKRTSYRVTPQAGSYTAWWRALDNVEFYEPFRALLLEILHRIRSGDSLPVLSTPTHEPGWIAPEVLVDRLAAWQAVSRNPWGVDWEIALARCSLPAAGRLPDLERLSGEPKLILEFLLRGNADPKGPFVEPGAWLTAALSRRGQPIPVRLRELLRHPLAEYTGEHAWNVLDNSHKYNIWSFQENKNVEKVNKNTVLKIERADRQTSDQQDTGHKSLLSRWLSRPREKVHTLYDSLRYSPKYALQEFNDIRRILSLTPNNPEPLLTDITINSLKFSRFVQESDRKMSTATAQFLFDTWRNPGPMSLLFLGCSLLNGDKTLSSLAAETWLRAVSTGTIDNPQFGRILGRLEMSDYAPLKRLTDLIPLRLFRVSPAHNHALEKLIAHILPELPDEPVKGLKRLLELYAELRAVNGSGSVPDRVRVKLEKWAGNAGLEKVVNGL
jgi:hypothetical protein